ncbi:alpha/beta hydrolase [Longimicrobium sp.]|uniref:alpha/beta fold hydrolase n=1 Tax=Longimicrobium sp. TaxID=2029185 RepID=UPI002D7FE84B|nr:alpha/beta hydrolase [Longimicrobium sp.]
MLLGITLATLAIASRAPLSAQAADGLRAGEHEVDVNGVRLWYRVAGDSATGMPPVVFLHGGPGQGSYHFAELVGPRMERSLRMVYLDQRGSGRSGRPRSGEYSMALLVEDVEALRQVLGAPRIALVGHSFGGTLALEYAAKYPEHVSALVFAAGLWDAPGQTRLRCRRTMEMFPDAARRALGDSAATKDPACDWFWNQPEAEREAMNNALMFPDSAVRIRLDSVQAASGQRNTGELGNALFRSGLLQYRFAAMRRLTMPVLVIAGRHDGAAVGAGLRDLARQLPHARYVEYENSGHFVYLDEPDRFARDVSAFVSSRR